MAFSELLDGLLKCLLRCRNDGFRGNGSAGNDIDVGALRLFDARLESSVFDGFRIRRFLSFRCSAKCRLP